MAVKLFTRYNLISLPSILGLFLLFGVGCYFFINHLLIADFDDSLSEEAEKINYYVKVNSRFPYPEPADEWLFSYRKTTGKNVPAYLQTVELYDTEDHTTKKYRSVQYSYRLKGQNYLITISKSLEPLNGLSRSIAIITSITLLLVIFTTVMLNNFVLKNLWRPFYKSLESLKEFSLGQPANTAFEETKIAEFNFMNAQLRSMIYNAEKEYRMLKEFSENASHEMQTPISIIQSKLDLIIQSNNLGDQESIAIQGAYQAVRRLASLGQALLLLSKIETNQFHEIACVSLQHRLKEKVGQLEELWTEKDLHIDCKLSSSCINANPDLIDILLNNLLSNAARHNLNGGSIRILLEANKLIISNAGLADEIDPARIFTRFHKQNPNSVGTGLGLAIIKQICDRSKIDLRYSFFNDLHTFSLTWKSKQIEGLTELPLLS